MYYAGGMGDHHKLEICRLLDFFFAGDKQKVIKWLSAPNLDFGGTTPSEMIFAKKEKLVLDHVRKAVFEYSWPEDELVGLETARVMH